MNDMKNLAKALIQFHSKVGKVAKDSNNPFFKSKYAGLPSILDAIREPLEQSELTFIQIPDGTGLRTVLLHSSGESIEGTFEMRPAKDDPQGWGSAITYARRYSLVSILGLNVDEDDDGNKATFGNSKPTEVKYEPKKVEPKKIVFVENGELTKAGFATANKLINNETTWHDILAKVSMTAQERKAIEAFVKENGNG